MSFLKTMQSCYEPLRSDVTIGDTNYLDGVTAGRTFDFNDKPTHAKSLTPNHNSVEVICPITANATDGDAHSFRIWGYAADGPAERLCDVSITTGTAKIGDSATALWVDTIVVTEAHSTAVYDSGTNRIAKLRFDTIGYSWLMVDFTTQGAVDLSATVNVWYRPY